MNDTVMKLMSMVDLLCSACVDDVCAGDQAIPNHESNASTLHADLEAELTRLFTPLRGQTFNTAGEAIAYLHGYAAAHDKYKIMGADPAVVGLAIHMEEHGITGEKNEVDAR